MRESITRVKGTIDRFSIGLKEDQEYMKLRADEKSCKTLHQIETWMGEREHEAQTIHFKVSKVTITQYTSRWNSRFKELKRELVFVVSGPVVLTKDLEELLASLGGRGSLGGQAEMGPTDGAEMRVLGANNSATDDLKAENLGAGK